MSPRARHPTGVRQPGRRLLRSALLLLMLVALTGVVTAPFTLPLGVTAYLQQRGVPMSVGGVGLHLRETGLRLHDVTLGVDGAGELAFEEVELRADRAGLLAGKLRLRELHVRGTRLDLAALVAADWRDELAVAREHALPGPATLVVEDAVLDRIGRRVGAEVRLSFLQLVPVDDDAKVPSARIEGRVEIDGAPLGLEGTLVGDPAAPHFSLAFDADAMPAGVLGEGRGAGSGGLLRGSGRIRGDFDPEAGTLHLRATGALEGEGVTAGVGPFALSDVDAAWRGEAVGRWRVLGGPASWEVSGRLRLTRARFTGAAAGTLEGVAWTGRVARLSGELAVSGELDVGAFTVALRGADPDAVLELELERLFARLDGADRPVAVAEVGRVAIRAEGDRGFGLDAEAARAGAVEWTAGKGLSIGSLEADGLTLARRVGSPWRAPSVSLRDLSLRPSGGVVAGRLEVPSASRRAGEREVRIGDLSVSTLDLGWVDEMRAAAVALRRASIRQAERGTWIEDLRAGDVVVGTDGGVAAVALTLGSVHRSDRAGVLWEARRLAGESLAFTAGVSCVDLGSMSARSLWVSPVAAHSTCRP
jgi:hypothetical protein